MKPCSARAGILLHDTSGTHLSSGPSLCCTKSPSASEPPALLLQLALLAMPRARTEWGMDACWAHWRAQSPAGHTNRMEGTEHGAWSVAGTHVLHAVLATQGHPDSQRHMCCSPGAWVRFSVPGLTGTPGCAPGVPVIPLIHVW